MLREYLELFSPTRANSLEATDLSMEEEILSSEEDKWKRVAQRTSAPDRISSGRDGIRRQIALVS